MTMLYILAAALLAAQSQPAPKTAPKPDPNAPLTMNGCVARDYTDSKDASAYTFVDNIDGTRYRLKGRSVSKYSGMSVQVTGSLETKKVKFVGGLYPSPNVAGQAGSIDPGKAAVAAMPGGGSTGVGNVDLPTLNVTRFILGQGECRR
jgi:hypothetical protein